MRRKKKTIECIEYLSVSAPLDKVDHLEDKQSKYIHEYVKNKEYMIVGTERRHGFSQNDVDRQWHQIVDKIRKKISVLHHLQIEIPIDRYSRCFLPEWVRRTSRFQDRNCSVKCPDISVTDVIVANG